MPKAKRHRAVRTVALACAALMLTGCAYLGDYLRRGLDAPSEEYVPTAEELVVPDRFTIVPDEWQARYVGRLGDGRSYFASHEFVIETSTSYLAVYFWKADGSFDEADIREFPSTPTSDASDVDAALSERVAGLDGATTEPITVAPCVVEQDDVQFGFLARAPSDDYYQVASVSHVPNDDMVYYWPWDGEGYDT